jgi:hypothetical protein
MSERDQLISGQVFSVRYLQTETRISDEPIGSFESTPDGDIKVSLKTAPWCGGHMIMRPNRPADEKAKPVPPTSQHPR